MNIVDVIYDEIFKFMSPREMLCFIERVCKKWNEYSRKYGYGWKTFEQDDKMNLAAIKPRLLKAQSLKLYQRSVLNLDIWLLKTQNLKLHQLSVLNYLDIPLLRALNLTLEFPTQFQLHSLLSALPFERITDSLTIEIIGWTSTFYVGPGYSHYFRRINCKSLKLSGFTIDFNDLYMSPNASRLEILYYRDDDTVNCSALSKFESLTELFIYAKRIDFMDIKNVKRLTFGAQSTDGKIYGLESLVCSSENHGEVLKNNPNLKYLTLDDCELDILDPMPSLTSLTNLTIKDTRIRRSTIDLVQYCIPRLKRLNIYGGFTILSVKLLKFIMKNLGDENYTLEELNMSTRDYGFTHVDQFYKDEFLPKFKNLKRQTWIKNKAVMRDTR